MGGMTPARVAPALLILSVVAGSMVGGFGWDTALFAAAALVATWALHAASPRRDPAAELPKAVPMPKRSDEARLTDAIADPVIVLDGERVVQANRASRDRFGEHIVDEDVRVSFRHPAFVELIGSPAARRSPQSLDLTGLGKPGVWWEARTAPLPDGRLIVHLVDRTAARAAERTRTDFVANASHELRTPLSAILGFVETLKEEAGEDPQLRVRFLGTVQREAARMGRLIEDLLSLSRIESERRAAPGDAVSLVAIARQVVGELSTRGLPPGRTLRVEAMEPLRAVAGDPLQLHQLLTNLVENALKYGRAGSPVLIQLARVDARLAELRVVDEGDGVAAEHLPRLTERFYRVDPGRSRRVGGTGLGLAIAKHVVERHRGTLRITSVPGTGTVVAVRLPFARGGSVDTATAGSD